MSLVETRAVMEEVRGLFSPEHDAQLIQRIRKEGDEVKLISQKKENQFLSIIKELQESVRSQAIATAQQPAQEVWNQQAVVASKMQQTTAEIGALEARISEEKHRLKSVEQTEEQLLLEKEQAQRTAAQEVPVVRATLKLYSNISNIEWDYDAKEDVKGYCHMPHTQCLRSFHIKKADGWTMSRVADFLWDLMWEDQQAAPDAQSAAQPQPVV